MQELSHSFPLPLLILLYKMVEGICLVLTLAYDLAALIAGIGWSNAGRECEADRG